MELKRADRAELASYLCADRIGFAKLTTMAFNGVDLRPMRDEIMAKIAMGTVDAGEGLDSVADRATAWRQADGARGAGRSAGLPPVVPLALFARPSRNSACWRSQRRWIWAATRRSSFCWSIPAIELQTLYVVDGVELPSPLPEHDVAIVIASDSEECREALRKIDRVGGALAAAAAQSAAARRQSRSRQAASSAARHRRPRYSRDRSRDPCAILGFGRDRMRPLADIAADMRFPIIIRPRGSHAGVGLAKIDEPRRARPLSRGTAGAGILRLALRRLRQ